MKINVSVISQEDYLSVKRYNFVDAVKFLMAILVIAVHINPFTSYNKYLNFGIAQVLGRLAVPFFFLCSGFFLFRKYQKTEDKRQLIVSYIKRLLGLYLIWTILYMPVLIYQYSQNSHHFLYNFIDFIRNLLLNGSYLQLWYLVGLIYAVAVIVLLMKKFKIETVLWISLCFYLLGLLGNSYYGIVEKIPALRLVYSGYLKVFYTTRNGIFFGFFFVTLGAYFAANKIYLNIRKSVIGLLISLTLLPVEVFILKKLDFFGGNDMYLLTIPVSFFLFYLASHINLPDHRIFFSLRECSILMFLSHLLFSYLLKAVEKMFSFTIENNSLMKYTFVLSCSIIFSVLVIKLERKQHFSFLKYLH